jgi:hypothetical protein
MGRLAMTNNESRARARTARYLMRQARALNLNDAEFAKALGVSKDRIRDLRVVIPQAHILHRMGACLEHIARTGEIPPPPARRPARRRRRGDAAEGFIDSPH